MQGLSVEMPGQYALAFAAMEELGCSWPDLQQTPAALVEEALVRRSARAKWERRKAEMEESRSKQKGGRG